jgi:hypothetical protein
MSMRATLALLSLVSALLAQQAPDPFRYVPADAAFVVRTKGPAAWRADLAATGLAKALSAPGTAASWKELFDSGRKVLDPDGAHQKQFGKLVELLLGYEGSIALACRLDFSKVTDEHPPGFCLSLALTGDGHTDLAELAKVIDDLLPEGAVDRELAGQQARVHKHARTQFTSPFLHEGALVMLCSSDLETQAALCLDHREHGFPVAPQLQSGVSGFQVEAYEPVRACLDAVAKLDHEEAKLIVKGIELAGARSLQRLVWNAFADGKHLGQEMRVEFNDGARGLFDVVLPVRRTRPKLLAYLPPNVPNWTIGIVDVQAAQALYGKVFEQFGEQLPQSREQIEAMFTEFTKLRLHEDFLSLLGNEYMRIDDFAAGVDVEDEGGQLGDSCFVVPLRDAKVAAQNLEKALRSRGMHAARKSEDYGDTKIYSLRLFATMPIEYAFAGDVFVLGLGEREGTRKNLRSVLDTVAARSKGGEPAELSAAVQTRLQGWPEDWAAIDAGDLAEVLDGLITSLDTALAMVAAGEMEEEASEFAHRFVEFARKLRPELMRHDAAVTLSATYSARDAWVVRSRW